MANSLMELYGGGMVGNRTNYQLGGRVAAAKRRRDYQGEMRELDRAAREAQRKQSRASGLGSILGTVGGLAGSLIPIPGVGTAVGAALGSAIGGGLGRLAGESTYQGTKVQGGKYARESRENLQGSVDDFKSSMGERALGQGLRSGLSTFISQGGADYLKAKFGQAQPIGLQAPEDLLDININQPITDVSERVRQSIRPDTPISMDNILMEGDLNFTDLSEITDTPLTDFSYDDLVQYGTFQGPAMDFMPAMRGGGMVNMMPKYEYGGFVKEREKERFDAMNTPTSFGNQANSSEENRGFMLPPAPLTSTFTPPGGNIGMPIQNNAGYGTATSAAGALRQLGMEGVLNDPRFAEFADDLPQFSMGYQQQIGDIYSGGQQAAIGMRGQQRQATAGTGFTGFGAGQTQSQQNFRNLGTDMQRQQRGVIEGFQSDLLSAIGDIEAKGEFEFGTSPEAMSAAVKNSLSKIRDAAAQKGFNPTQTTTMQPLQEEEEEEYYNNPSNYFAMQDNEKFMYG